MTRDGPMYRRASMDELKDEYMRLRESYLRLVGSMYPSIAYGDLQALRARYISFGGDAADLPVVPAPRADGRVPGN